MRSAFRFSRLHQQIPMTKSSQVDPKSIDSRATAHNEFTDILHEFRTSLNTILMSVELLAQKETFGTQIDRKYYLQHIRGAVGTMKELLSQNEPKERKLNRPNHWNSSPDSLSPIRSPRTSSDPSKPSRT